MIPALMAELATWGHTHTAHTHTRILIVDKLNRLADLSLAQLSPILFLLLSFDMQNLRTSEPMKPQST